MRWQLRHLNYQRERTFSARTRQLVHDRASRIAPRRNVVRMQNRKLGKSNLEVSAIGPLVHWDEFCLRAAEG